MQNKLMWVLGLLVILGLSSSVQSLVVLQYHHVSEKTPASTSISPSLFASHLDFLAKNEYDIMAMPDFFKLMHEGKPIPDRTAIITFDDGYMSVYTEAFPLLKKRKWPFTVFVNSKAHDEKNHLFMSWEQLRELSKHGATIANHTDSHPHLIRQQSYESFDEWQTRRQREITFAQQRIKKEIGKAEKVFAYPFGEYDMDLQKWLKKEGYIAFGQQSGPISTADSLQALPRFPFGGMYGKEEDFVPKVTSLPFSKARVKVTDNDGRVLQDAELPAKVERPVLRIASPLMRYIKNFNCYASGQGKIEAEVKGGVAVVRANKPLPVGRSRYNCTASAGNGRFFWYSHMFIRRKADGTWYNE